MSNKKKDLLGFNLDELISASVNSLFESSFTDKPAAELDELLNQQKMEKALGKQKSRFSKKKKGNAGDEADDGITKQVQVKPEKIPDIDAKAIRNKIDNIRAGRSLKQKDVKEALHAYFQKLNGPERIAIYAFLTGLEKILGDASKKVKAPHQEPFNIDMEEDKQVDGGKVKRKQKGSKEISKNPESENPIIVGESQDKRNILKVINSKRRR